MKRIGVFGGTFDPVHFGHLLTAQTVLEKLDLDKILFIPAARNPFKSYQSREEREHSYRMLEESFFGNPRFDISDIELKREGKSYTYDTIKALIDQEDADYYFLTGSDLLDKLDHWYKIDKLLKMVTFVVVGRPKAEENLLEKIDYYKKKYDARIIFCRTNDLDISSTAIRNRVYLGKPINYYTPKKVITYIENNGLYAGDVSFEEEVLEIKKRLRERLKPSRYQHTLGVVETAKDLAELYEVDIKKAILAALLHDAAKSMTLEEMIALAEEENFDLPPVTKANENIIHAPVGALVARKDFGIEDPQILHAIATHTTGEENMSKLDKVIFLADAIEPGRVYEGVDKLRMLSTINLDQAVLSYIEHTIDYLKDSGKEIDPKIYLVRNSLLKQINKDESRSGN